MEDINVICVGCVKTEYELAPKALRNNDYALKFFEMHKIISSEVYCPNCNCKCSIREDQNIFRCENIINIKYKHKRKECLFSVSRFYRTFLEKCKIEPWKVLLSIY